ncbi:RNA polymerase sigma factor [Nonomuraea sp. AD125B]|uniref:RNA polymerase sigma factor n=1 Tax=Nonomuraea sp. AD125B TaxID=3242897 RepID=UPI0035284149
MSTFEQLETKTQDVLRDEFEDFYRGNFADLVWFLIRWGARAEAEDAAQEAMKDAFRNWSSIHSAPRLWVRAAATRIVLRHRQKNKLLQNKLFFSCLADHVSYSSSALLVLEMLDTLPREQREVMAWIIDGYEPGEIAAMTGQKPATVRSHARHAREKLKALHRQHIEAAGKEASDGP